MNRSFSIQCTFVRDNVEISIEYQDAILCVGPDPAVVNKDNPFLQLADSWNYRMFWSKTGKFDKDSQYQTRIWSFGEMGGVLSYGSINGFISVAVKSKSGIGSGLTLWISKNGGVYFKKAKFPAGEKVFENVSGLEFFRKTYPKNLSESHSSIFLYQFKI